jgi:hypothetical protein
MRPRSNRNSSQVLFFASANREIMALLTFFPRYLPHPARLAIINTQKPADSRGGTPHPIDIKERKKVVHPTKTYVVSCIPMLDRRLFRRPHAPRLRSSALSESVAEHRSLPSGFPVWNHVDRKPIMSREYLVFRRGGLVSTASTELFW